MLGHPSRSDLLAHAEGLADGGAISADVARHVAKCSACADELKAIRASLAFVGSAGALEPSSESTQSILMAARSERVAMQSRRSFGRTVWGLTKATACAAAVVLVCVVSFQTALSESTAPQADQQAAAPAKPDAAVISPDEVRKANAEVQTLAAAVSARSTRPQSMQELRHARFVLALEADLQTARAALERNPGCERAGAVVNTSIKRQAQALKSLYLERTL